MFRTILILLIFQFTNLYAQPDTLWQRVYDNNDRGETCITGIQTNDGGFMLGGTRYSFENNYNMHVKKVDSQGELEWTSTFVTPSSGAILSLLQHPDNYYYGTGNFRYRNMGATYGYLLKFDENGDSLWTSLIGGESSSIRCSVLSRDSCIVVGGKTSEFARFGGSDAFMAKFDPDGEEIWSSVFGGDGNDYIYGMTNTEDGGYALCGETRSFGNGIQFYLVKTDSLGEVEWSNAYGDSLSDLSFAIVQCADGGFALAGKSYFWNNGMNSIGSLVRTDDEGNEIWSRHYGTGGFDWFNDLICIEDNGFVLAGQIAAFHSAMYIVRTDSQGEELWAGYYNITRSIDTCEKVIRSEDSGFYFIGQASANEGMVLIKTAPDPASVLCLIDPAFPAQYILHTPYPNPFNSTTRIAFQLPYPSHVNLSICDQQGREVTVLLNQNMAPGTHEVRWQAEDQPSGMYFCMMDADGFRISRKVAYVR